jgi:hypothetical protein
MEERLRHATAGLCSWIEHGNTVGGNQLLQLFFQHRLAGGGGGGGRVSGMRDKAGMRYVSLFPVLVAVKAASDRHGQVKGPPPPSPRGDKRVVTFRRCELPP